MLYGTKCPAEVNVYKSSSKTIMQIASPVVKTLKNVGTGGSSSNETVLFKVLIDFADNDTFE